MENQKLIILISLVVVIIGVFLFRLNTITGNTIYEFNQVVNDRIDEIGDSGIFGYVDGIWIIGDTLHSNGWAHDYDHLNTALTVKVYFKDEYIGETVANLPHWETEFGTWENELLYNIDMRYEIAINISELLSTNPQEEFLDQGNYKFVVTDSDTDINYEIAKHGSALTPTME